MSIVEMEMMGVDDGLRINMDELLDDFDELGIYDE